MCGPAVGVVAPAASGLVVTVSTTVSKKLATAVSLVAMLIVVAALSVVATLSVQ